MKEKLRKFMTVAMAIGFIVGGLILVYPLIANVWNHYRNNLLFVEYSENKLSDLSDESLKAEWEKARQYNSNLEPIIIPDSFVQAQNNYNPEDGYMSCLNIDGDGIMGFISIPRIDVKLPIGHTTDNEVLEKYVGHIHGSSLPIGGESNHAVLSAHRGLPNASLFTDLDLLEKGDQFYIYVLDEILAYEVDNIRVVEPSDTKGLEIIEGEDLISLVTCTPYGVNSHRLIVRGHRVEYSHEKELEQEANQVNSSHTNYVLWIAVGAVITAAVLIIVTIVTGRKRKDKEKAGKS